MEIKSANDRTKLEISKSKLVLLLLGSALFILAGVYLILESKSFASSRGESQLVPIVVGIVCIAFFGVCLINILRLMFSRNGGLVMDQDGITDNSHSTSVGFIDWNDITRIESVDLISTKVLLLFTDKPEKYINRAKTNRFRRVLKANHRKFGTPISIVSGTLEVRIDDLESMIRKKLNEKGRTK